MTASLRRRHAYTCPAARMLRPGPWMALACSTSTAGISSPMATPAKASAPPACFSTVLIYSDPRKSYGGYLQGSYTFNKVFTVGGSWGASYLDTANSTDAANEAWNCSFGSSCLVHENSSWIGFARYKLTKWVNLQAEYISTTAKSVDYYGFHNTNRDNTVAVGTTFFW